MSFSTFGGTAIIPTLSRVVLCTCFITTGYTKVFSESDFSGDDAQRLIELDVISMGDMQTARPGLELHRVAYRPQDSETGGASEPDPQDVEPPAKAEDPPAEPATKADPPAKADPAAEQPLTELIPEVPDTGVYSAKRMHHVTLLVDRAGWPEPVLMARVAAFTELIGGALLVIGLFSRIWGLGLAAAMGVAFYLTSWPALGGFPPELFKLSYDHHMVHQVYGQLALCVLSLGIFFTGPGPLSFDRVLFGGRKAGKPPIDDESF